MSGLAISTGKFVSAWLPAALVVAAVDPAPRLADLWAFDVGGLVIPSVTCVLGALGVIGARPLARKGEKELSGWAFLLVTLLMVAVVEIWVVEHRPGALFAFVVAIGLGFSGYSLIELVGGEVKNIVASRARSLADRFGSPPATPAAPTPPASPEKSSDHAE